MPVGVLEANCYFVYDDGSAGGFIVDPGGDSEEILENVAQTGASIEAVLVTHGHSDHLGATGSVAQVANARIYGSEEVGSVLGSPDDHLLIPGMAPFEAAAVAQTLSGGESLELAGSSIEVISTPGHSPGSLTYHCEDGLFCGDLLFRGAVGRADLPGGSFEQLLESIKKLMEAYPPQTKVYTGHGSATTLKWEKENNPFLSGIKW
ncbi:MAG: MBL fold metallo-hydrolase [Actinomycetota bacterium]